MVTSCVTALPASAPGSSNPRGTATCSTGTGACRGRHRARGLEELRGRATAGGEAQQALAGAHLLREQLGRRVAQRENPPELADGADGDRFEAAEPRTAKIVRGELGEVEGQVDPHAAREAAERHSRVQRIGHHLSERGGEEQPPAGTRLRARAEVVRASAPRRRWRVAAGGCAPCL
jgi:hypothetical protein